MTDVRVDPESKRVLLGQLEPGDRFMGPSALGASPDQLVGAMVTNLVFLPAQGIVEIDSRPHQDWQASRPHDTSWPMVMRLRDGHVYALPPGTGVIRLGAGDYAEPGQIVMRYDTRTGASEVRVGPDLAEDEWGFEGNAWGDMVDGRMQPRTVQFRAHRGRTPRRDLVLKLAQEARELWKVNAGPAQLQVRETIDFLLRRALSPDADRRSDMLRFVRGEEDKP